MQARAVAPHGDDVLVPLRKCIGEGICKPLPKRVPLLLGIGHLEDRQPTLSRSLQCVPVERLGDLPIFRIVLPDEPLVLPLALGAVAEEQNGGVGIGPGDGLSAPENERDYRSEVGVR